MSVIRWEEPPAKRSNLQPGLKYPPIAGALRARRFAWARILDDGSTSVVNQIKTGRIPAFRPAGSFEARGQRKPDGKYIVWARYVGGEAQ